MQWNFAIEYCIIVSGMKIIHELQKKQTNDRATEYRKGPLYGVHFYTEAWTPDTDGEVLQC